MAAAGVFVAGSEVRGGVAAIEALGSGLTFGASEVQGDVPASGGSTAGASEV